jgi:hypothetical protein
MCLTYGIRTSCPLEIEVPFKRTSSSTTSVMLAFGAIRWPIDHKVSPG